MAAFPDASFRCEVSCGTSDTITGCAVIKLSTMGLPPLSVYRPIKCVVCLLTGHLLTRGVTARVPTHEEETHEDFKPKFNPEAEPRSAPTVEDQIKEDINENSVFLYMKVPPHQYDACLAHCMLLTLQELLNVFNYAAHDRACQRRPNAGSATWRAGC